MATLEELAAGTLVEGVVADGPVEVVSVKWFGQTAVELTYKVGSTGAVSNRLLYRTDEDRLTVSERRRAWGVSFAPSKTTSTCQHNLDSSSLRSSE